jgi:hypothetical protein
MLETPLSETQIDGGEKGFTELPINKSICTYPDNPAVHGWIRENTG